MSEDFKKFVARAMPIPFDQPTLKASFQFMTPEGWMSWDAAQRIPELRDWLAVETATLDCLLYLRPVCMMRERP